MADKGQNAHAIGDILDRLERGTREVARSIDARNRLDLERLARARDDLSLVLSDLDGLIAAESASA